MATGRKQLMATRTTEQYRLHAYVCGRSCIKRSSYEGVVNYRTIFNGCPTECRYAVVSYWDIVRHEERVAVFDMDATVKRPGVSLSIEPGPPIEYYNTVDAAIMATALLYEE